MASANRPQQSSKLARQFLSCLRQNWISAKPALILLGGSLAFTAVADAQQPRMQPAVETANVTPGGPVRLQSYDVPTDLIGPVGARLQIQFAQTSDVQVTTDPKTGKLMILAPELVHRQIGAQIQTLLKNANVSSASNDKGINVGSYQQLTYHLRNLSWRELEDSITRLAGPKLTVTTERNGEMAVFRIPNSTGMQDVLQVDRRMNQVNVLGGGMSGSSWMQVMHSLDEGQVDRQKTTHILPLAPAEPRRVKRAFQLVKATLPQDQTTATIRGGQIVNPPQGNAQQGNPNDPATAIVDKNGVGESGLFGDVQIEFIEEIDLVIIRGSKRDVERTLEVIQKIKDQATQTQPAIEVYPLKHANSQAVATLVTKLYEDIYQNRQGPVSITALGQPNSLLLIGRSEVVDSVIKLVDKLDVELDPSNQLKVVRMLHASAVDAEATIRNFFVENPGAGETAREALGTRVKVLADFRTNSLILQGAPRELLEVEKLISQIDVEGTTATNEIRVFPLKNTTAEDLQTVIQSVIDGEATGGGGGGGGQGGGGGGGSGQATPPSGKLSIIPSAGDEDSKIESGILAGVVVTPDPKLNALVVRAPAKSMELIGELISQLDSLPSAEARIKVFQVKNGDATQLATLLQQLFGLPVTAGQSTTGGFLGLGTQQQALTTGGEGSLVQLRVSVDTRTNSIIVSGGANDLEVIEVLLLRLDEDGVQTRRTEVVWLRNTNAVNVATALTNFLNEQRTATTQTLFQGGLITAFERVDREVFVVAEELTNSLVLSATPRYFDSMMKIIERLDRRPPLVAIQVLIAQVTLSDQFEFGTEFGLQDSLLYDRGIASQGTLSSPGFNVASTIPAASTGGTLANLNALGGVDQRQQVAGQGLSSFAMGRQNNTLGYGGLVLSAASESVSVLLRALQDANRVQILSRPQIMTMDNRQAYILVGQSVPRVSGTTQTQTGQSVSSPDVPVGLEMTVIPRVNQDGLIVMPLIVTNSSLGAIDSGVPVGFSTNGSVIRSPIINKTTAQTTISAYSGQTVVFAGLIQKNRSSVSRKIPFLGDIPVLGAAFRFESESESRTELLVIMTPRIIDTDEKVEIHKQVESSRMSWCLADILNIHGDAGLNGGNGLWGPAKGPVIFPDMQPTAIIDNTMDIPVETVPMSSVLDSNYVPSVPATSTVPGSTPGASNIRPNGPTIQSVSYPGNSQPRVPAPTTLPILTSTQSSNAPQQPNAPQQSTVTKQPGFTK